MNKFTKKAMSLALAFALTILCMNGIVLSSRKTAQAASYHVLKLRNEGDGDESVKKTVSGFTIKLQTGSPYRTLTIKKNGKETLVTKKAGLMFITDGKYLYFEKLGSDVSEGGKIIKYTLSSGKQKKLAKGNLLDSTGQYIYYTVYDKTSKSGDRSYKCYTMDLRTEKKVFMRNSYNMCIIKGNKILLRDGSGCTINQPFYTADLNGTGVKYIDKGVVYKVTKSKLYYYKAQKDTAYIGDGEKVKKYTCSLNGTNKKAISGWTKKAPYEAIGI